MHQNWVIFIYWTHRFPFSLSILCYTINNYNFFYIHTAALEEEQRNNANSNGTDKSELSNKQKHQMKHRELFLSRQVETLPATHIRGKCSVTLLNEEESLLSYLNKDVSSCTVWTFHELLTWLEAIQSFDDENLWLEIICVLFGLP